MPELPEVETIVRALRDCLVGETVREVQIIWPGSIATPAPEVFAQALPGHTIREVSRRGKFILITLEPTRYLLVHLRMTGRMLLAPCMETILAPKAHTHVMLLLASGRVLRFDDTRKFGRLYLVDDPAEVVGALGPEPLGDEFTPAEMRALLRRRRQIKPLLLDQRELAGLGNIYVDEALWLARIHPLRRANTLSEAEAERLYTAIRTVLEGAITHKGTTFRDYRGPLGESGENQLRLEVYGRRGEPCSRCGTPIERAVIGGRGTHYCPLCQPFSLDLSSQPDGEETDA